MTVVGWLGNACLLTGAWQVGHRRRFGFVFSMAGGLCWLSEAAAMGRLDWIFIELVMFAVAARNFWKWGKNVRVHQCRCQ